MRQLIVLVGPPGSGKTAFRQGKADWAVVSKDAIRQSVFGHSFEPEFEEAVDRIFSSAVIETAESSADVVCVDDLNLLRKERRAYVDLGQITGRETVAVIMPYEPLDELYELVQRQLDELRNGSEHITVSNFPRERFDAMLRCYEAVLPDEGFTQIQRHEQLPLVSGITTPPAVPQRARRKRVEKQHPIPLFAS